MIVRNIASPKTGRKIPNQFVITEKGGGTTRETFQSYNSIVAMKITWQDGTKVILDKHYWDYSKTTGKYRNIFLGETKKETLKKIKSGVYSLKNLNS